MPKPRTTTSTFSGDQLLTAQQVADRLQVSLRSVRRWIANDDLPVHRLGRALRITERDLERFLQRSR